MKKNRLAFISLKSLSLVFVFDSFYFITYLCLNEEKQEHLIPASKEICTSLYTFVLYYNYIYVYIYLF